MVQRYLDFEIVKEVWNVYELQDGTKIKIRFMLTAVRNEGKKRQIQFDQKIVTLCDESVCGKPSEKGHTPEQLQQNIEIDNCPYNTMVHEPSEYHLDDNSRVLIHQNVMSIARTKLFDQEGNRIYLVDVTGSLNVKSKKLNV
ncbi:MAG: hypothetical protein OXI27_06650 [Thaumarchaeota archaeon]|nr:hypothetical protein [Nitrososphaerota archaeon]